MQPISAAPSLAWKRAKRLAESWQRGSAYPAPVANPVPLRVDLCLAFGSAGATLGARWEAAGRRKEWRLANAWLAQNSSGGDGGGGARNGCAWRGSGGGGGAAVVVMLLVVAGGWRGDGWVKGGGSR